MLPYITPAQAELLYKYLQKELKTSVEEIDKDTPTKMSDLINDVGYVTESALGGMVSRDYLIKNYYTSAATQGIFPTREEFNRIIRSLFFIDLGMYPASRCISFIFSLSEDFIAANGNPRNINGQVFNESLNNYSLGDSYICIKWRDGEMPLYDLYSVVGNVPLIIEALVGSLNKMEEELENLKSVQVPALPENIEGITYVLKCIDGVLTWVEE